MSKSIEDYREIVKVLKLQLLKIRQQNNSLSKQLGVASQTQTSSFTPRVEKYRNSSTSIGKYLYLYNLFAHKCQLIGVTPQMIFRIADKKRDKEVSTNNMRQIMKRLKLKLNDQEITRLLDSITKSNNIFYEQYLQYLNAFQINSQIYPYKGQRTYSQKCLLKFGDQIRSKDSSASQLCRNIIDKEGTPYISYQNFVKYCRNNTKLKDVQIICAFVALDTQSQCQLSRDQFIRQMNKIYGLLEKGVGHEDDAKIERQKPIKQQKNDDAQFNLTEQTGAEAGAKTKKKQPGKEVKANKNDLVQVLQKEGVPVNSLIAKLLQKQQKRNLIRPFSLNDFYKVVQGLKSSITKKKVLQFFKNLDSANNGSVSTDQLVKIWLQGRKINDSPNTLLQLLARHFKQIQSKQYITRFNTLGYRNDDKINTEMLKNVLSGLDLQENYIKLIQSNLAQNITIDQFVKALEKGGIDNKQKAFKPLQKSDFQKMKAIVYKFFNEKQKGNYQFKKLSRLQNQEDPQKNNEYWETIFTDQWACWNYCLEAAYKLDTFWKDHQFGPSKGDPHGYRSIVGNQSKVPAGLPDQQEITWVTFQKLLDLQNNKKQEVKLFNDNLVANDILQGKVGNCWFVSALSIITANDQLIYGKPIQYCKRYPEGLTFGIHPILFHYFRRFGIYVFKFFKNFKPIYVLVDSLFPVQISNNQLVFAKSPNAGLQWVAFLQKAYAKLHHSYTNLISGQISQGLADLTSCLPIKENLSSNRSDQLLEKMKTLTKQKQLMGCSITTPPGGKVQVPVLLDDQKTGLFYGHAYSLMDLIDLNQVSSKDFKLVRVRNPWGHGQWGLDWSDKPLNDQPQYQKLKEHLPIVNKYYDQKIAKGKKMKQNIKQIQKYQIGQDGQFLMNFYDFAKIFSNLFTGYNIKDKQYKCYQFKGKWNKSTPSGICKAKGASQAEKVQFVKNNYQFILEVKQQTDIIIFLMQEDGRLYRGQQYPYKEICNGINILVFTLKNDQMLQKFEVEKMTLPNLKFELKRQVNFWHKFKPGRYAVIPCKIANKIPQSDFQIRVYSQRPIPSLKKVKGVDGGNFTDLPESTKVYKQSVISQMVDLINKLQATK